MGESPSDQQGGQRRIPAVHQVLAAYRDAGGTYSDPFVVPLIRSRLDIVRHSPDARSDSSGEIVQKIIDQLIETEHARLRPVLNGTGVILHTNLGRAPVSAATAVAMAAAARSPVPLELDPESGRRGNRMDEVARLLHGLTGAESALVVNNNAAAILLVLSALASGREVLVSRGEAVEIGGGVRVPDLLAQSGARMVEVGTTNRTYADDYARAVGPMTAALLKVHPSNFRMQGFVHRASIADVAPVANAAGIPVIEDQGSGLLIDPAAYGLAGDRPVSESIEAGSGIVTMSGDKLIGGPQAGIIVGRADLVERCARHPLARAVRADKVTLAGVAETLRHYARGDAITEIPIWKMIATSVTDLQARADVIFKSLDQTATRWSLVDAEATIGGGSMPGTTLPSLAIAWSGESGAGLDRLGRELRTGDPPIYGYIDGNRFLIDLRTIPPERDIDLIERLARL